VRRRSTCPLRETWRNVRTHGEGSIEVAVAQVPTRQERLQEMARSTELIFNEMPSDHQGYVNLAVSRAKDQDASDRMVNQIELIEDVA
jgi:hypothetical protein